MMNPPQMMNTNAQNPAGGQGFNMQGGQGMQGPVGQQQGMHQMNSESYTSKQKS